MQSNILIYSLIYSQIDYTIDRTASCVCVWEEGGQGVCIICGLFIISGVPRAISDDL
jgi:hypothetical protein